MQRDSVLEEGDTTQDSRGPGIIDVHTSTTSYVAETVKRHNKQQAYLFPEMKEGVGVFTQMDDLDDDKKVSASDLKA